MPRDAALQLPDDLPGAQALTQPEAEFVHLSEVIGLPLRKAAQMAGLSLTAATRPHLYEAREQMKRQLRGRVGFTKEDVLHGIHDAIDRARIIAEPATEIQGWKQISTMLGYDAPAKVDIRVKAEIEVLNQHVRALPDAELVALLDAGEVIDGEFYAVPQPVKPE